MQQHIGEGKMHEWIDKKIWKFLRVSDWLFMFVFLLTIKKTMFFLINPSLHLAVCDVKYNHKQKDKVGVQRYLKIQSYDWTEIERGASCKFWLSMSVTLPPTTRNELIIPLFSHCKLCNHFLFLHMQYIWLLTFSPLLIIITTYSRRSSKMSLSSSPPSEDSTVPTTPEDHLSEIGRASCRERVCLYV